MRQRPQHVFLAAVFVAGLAGALGARPVRAQEVGSIAAVEGRAEIGHAGAWTPATVGALVQRGDEIRTTRPGGRLSLAARDDSVLNVGDGTDLTIEAFVFEPRYKRVHSRVRLLAGKVRPVVGADYQQAGTVYEIETGTAVVKVRGTEFVVAYDPVAEVSEVVGVTGTVEVHGVSERPGRRGVFVTTQELSTVAKGQLPAKAQPISDKLFRQYIEDLEFIGGGQAESQAVKLSTEKTVPPTYTVDGLQALAGPTTLVPGVPEPGKPPWSLLTRDLGDDWPGTSPTLGGIISGPPGASGAPGTLDVTLH